LTGRGERSLTADRAGIPAAADNSGAPVSFLVDYDGTISLVDIGDELLTRHYPDKAEIARKDAEYDAGIVGSRELMQWDMDVLPHDPEMLRSEAAAMPQDPTFPAFVRDMQARGALVEVVSDGLGFYVRPNLAELGLSDVPVATNDNTVADGGAGRARRRHVCHRRARPHLHERGLAIPGVARLRRCARAGRRDVCRRPPPAFQRRLVRLGCRVRKTAAAVHLRP
jgi:hypothetical protein